MSLFDFQRKQKPIHHHRTRQRNTHHHDCSHSPSTLHIYSSFSCRGKSLLNNSNLFETLIAMSLSPSKRKLEDDSGEGIQGVQLEFQGESVVVISSRETRDVQRWRENMPSLTRFPHLTEVDLHKNRYITSLDPSVTTLTQLKVLGLSQCSRLRELPATIGSLPNLQVVGSVLLLS